MSVLRTVAFALLVAAKVSLAASPSSPAPLPPGAFAFDRTSLGGLVEAGREVRDGVTVRDVHFQSPAGRKPVKAYLVDAVGPGPHPAVLFVHWLGEPETSNRTQFLREATGLAKRGVVSLLVDGMWSAPDWYRDGRTHANDYADALAQVKELQRAMDLLLAQKDVDPKRVAFVGHDFGAMYGVLMGAAEPRAKTYVLLAPTTTFHEWFLLGKKKPADLEAYVARMAPLDPVRYLPRVGGSVFLQFAKTDRYVAPEKAQAFADAAAPPKLFKVYDNTDHAMTSADGLQERYRWLARELQLKER